MSSIYADLTVKRVVWRMTAEEAKTVARFIRDETSRDDEAQGDAWALDQAAESLDPMSDDSAPRSQ